MRVPSNVTNNQIRKIAWDRVKTHYGSLLAASILFSIPSGLKSILTILYANEMIMASTSWSICWLIDFLAMPLKIGCIAFFYEMYVNGEVKFGKLFNFYTEKKLLTVSAVLGFVFFLLSLLMSMPNSFLKTFVDLAETNKLFMILEVFAKIIGSYIGFRLFLAFYIFAQDTDKSVGNIIRESFLYTKYRLLETLCFGISIGWWLILLLGISLILFSLFIPAAFGTLFSTPMVFFIPHIQMAIAGFAHKLLPNAKMSGKSQRR